MIKEFAPKIQNLLSLNPRNESLRWSKIKTRTVLEAGKLSSWKFSFNFKATPIFELINMCEYNSEE